MILTKVHKVKMIKKESGQKSKIGIRREMKQSWAKQKKRSPTICTIWGWFRSNICFPNSMCHKKSGVISMISTSQNFQKLSSPLTTCMGKTFQNKEHLKSSQIPCLNSLKELWLSRFGYCCSVTSSHLIGSCFTRTVVKLPGGAYLFAWLHQSILWFWNSVNCT